MMAMVLISQLPLAVEPLNKGRVTHHTYPWALPTFLVRGAFEDHMTSDMSKYFFRCSDWSEPQLFRWISGQHIFRWELVRRRRVFLVADLSDWPNQLLNQHIFLSRTSIVQIVSERQVEIQVY